MLGTVFGRIDVTKVSNYAVALKLGDEATACLDPLAAAPQKRAQDVTDILGIEFGEQSGRTDQIAEHDRELATLRRPTRGYCPDLRIAGFCLRHNHPAIPMFISAIRSVLVLRAPAWNVPNCQARYSSSHSDRLERNNLISGNIMLRRQSCPSRDKPEPSCGSCYLDVEFPFDI